MRAISNQKLVQKRILGLFADSDDGLEKEYLDEACFGKSKLSRLKQKA